MFSHYCSIKDYCYNHSFSASIDSQCSTALSFQFFFRDTFNRFLIVKTATVEYISIPLSTFATYFSLYLLVTTSKGAKKVTNNGTYKLCIRQKQKRFLVQSVFKIYSVPVVLRVYLCEWKWTQ